MNTKKKSNLFSIIFFCLAVIALFSIKYFYNKYKESKIPKVQNTYSKDKGYYNEEIVVQERQKGFDNTGAKVEDYFPSSKGEIVNHQYYSLSYIEEYEQAEWVCYKMSKEILRRPNVPRSDWFNKDPMVRTGSAEHFQYKGSGYTRGHLVPAGDMSFDKVAMDESFYMSNMSPQIRGFNNGVWRELEEQTRDWIYQNKEVIIVSGPIFYGKPKYFKKHRIAIPDAFYKIIFDIEGDKKAIAFIIPHEVSTLHLRDFATTIDKVEELTGINFFENYMTSSIENYESRFDLELWPISDARYKLRVESWNSQ